MRISGFILQKVGNRIKYPQHLGTVQILRNHIRGGGHQMITFDYRGGRGVQQMIT